MANKIKEEARRLYDSYGADEEGMDKVIMEHYKEIMGTDKISKMILQLIMHEMVKNNLSPLEALTGLAMASASFIDVLEKADCCEDSENLEEGFLTCFHMGRLIEQGSDMSDEDEEDEEN